MTTPVAPVAVSGCEYAVAMVRWGAWETAKPMFEAVTLGQLDRFVLAPEEAGDEEFHRHIAEFLEEWATRRGGGFEAVRIIGDRWSERAQHLRDTFTRNKIPIGFYHALTNSQSAPLKGDQCRRNGARRAFGLAADPDLWRKMMRPLLRS